MPATAEECAAYRQRLKIRARQAVAVLGIAMCASCSSTSGLEFAHLKPTSLSGCGRGLTRRMLDVIRNSTKYVLLCKTCHDKMDGRIHA